MPRSSRGIEPCEKNHPIFKKFQITPRWDCLIDSFESAVEKLAHSHPWALLPEIILERHKSRVASLAPPTGWDASVKIKAIWPRGQSVSAPPAELIHSLRKYGG